MSIDLVANQRGEARLSGTLIATLDRFEDISGAGFGDALYGDGGANRIEGRGGNDTLVGGAGDDTMSGGIGQDLFRIDFAASQGIDTIIDFLSGQERVELANSGFADGQAVYDAIVDVNGVAVLTVGADQVTFQGLTKAQLSAGDFWV